jgi:hypothetical protein
VPLSQPHPGATAVLVDELDATRCQSLSDGTYRRDRYLPSLRFEIDYRRQSQRCGIRKLALRGSKLPAATTRRAY